MTFGVIFQNNVRALQHGRRVLPSSYYTQRRHTNAVVALQGRKGAARNLKTHFRATSDVVMRETRRQLLSVLIIIYMIL